MASQLRGHVEPMKFRGSRPGGGRREELRIAALLASLTGDRPLSFNGHLHRIAERSAGTGS
ncbi:hypothetical protein [Streptomyces clavifer]|uniref:hypothetical protein n=1 Tax=Streptomyces clavifer TaxID=68188 RepID=UPI0033AF8D36